MSSLGVVLISFADFFPPVQCTDMAIAEAIMVEQIGYVAQVSYSDFLRRYVVVMVVENW